MAKKMVIRWEDDFYEIPEDVLEKHKISAEDFKKKQEEGADVEGQGCWYTQPMQECKWSLKSYAASCL